MDLGEYREQYGRVGLDSSDLDPDPLVQFQGWFRDTEAAGVYEPNAVVVSTVDADGWPTARVVLLKSADERGFVFFTNYTSDKGRQLDATGRAALTFAWTDLRRQVRVVGAVDRLDPASSDEYFATRPRGSQLGAWASDQSSVVADRSVFDDRYAALSREYDGRVVPRPEHWGGYVVTPNSYEFWQGRDDRLHDRFRYRAAGDGWLIERLEP